jgi:UDP-2,3-diacylglucosamine pyrophosphatase LpxH
MEKKSVLLEESTNTHILTGNVEVIKKMSNMNTFVLNTNGCSIVEHGHHAVVSTEPETKRIIKITQQEFNPITRALVNSFD